MKSLAILLIVLGFGVVSHAQQNEKPINVDSLFLHARENVFSGKYADARALFTAILKINSTHTDAQLFLARIYAWEGDYEKAKQSLEIVLQHHPTQEEALLILVDIANWSHNYEEGLLEATKALSYHPASEPLLFKKAQLQYTLKNYVESQRSLATLLTLNPIHKEGLNLYESVKEKLLHYEASLSIGADQFNHTFDPAYYSSVQLSRKNTWGLASIRTNYSKRFGTEGIQSELELYPTLSKKTYAYVNYGYSKSILFPTHRMGAEVYSLLLKSIEGSLGFRHLDFGSLNKVWIYTGSIAWYKKEYWLMFRPSLISNQDITTYATYLAVRKYFKDEKSYISLTASMGLLPDERRLQSGVGTDADRSYTLKSNSMGLALNKSLAANFTIRLNYEFTHREIAFDSNDFIWINTAQITLFKKF